MRTHLLAAANRKLSTIDRNLTQLMFISEQFILDNSDQIASSPDGLTSKIYKDNQFRNDFNYRLGEIPKEVETLRSFACESAFSFSYSIYNNYIGDLLKLVQQICESSRSKKDKETLIDFMFEAHLGTTAQSHFSVEEIDTLEYIRLRRNVLVHAEGHMSRELEKYTKKGAKLNAFWRSFNLQALNFMSHAVERYTIGETIDLLRLIRDLSSKIDEIVLSLIGKPRIIVYEVSDFKARFKNEIVNQPRNKIERRLLRDAEYRFGLESGDINLSTISL